MVQKAGKNTPRLIDYLFSYQIVCTVKIDKGEDKVKLIFGCPQILARTWQE